MTCAANLSREEKADPTLWCQQIFFLVCQIKVNIKESAVFDPCQKMKREDVKEFLYITTDFRGLFRRLLLHCGVLPQVLCYKDALSQLYPTFEEAQGAVAAAVIILYITEDGKFQPLWYAPLWGCW